MDWNMTVYTHFRTLSTHDLKDRKEMGVIQELKVQVVTTLEVMLMMEVMMVKVR
jgi:hypothetical protein